MLIRGPQIHEATWSRLRRVCKQLSAELDGTVDKLTLEDWEIDRIENHEVEQLHPAFEEEQSEDPEEEIENALWMARYNLNQIFDAVEDKRTDDLREDFADFFDFAHEGLADVEYYWDGVQEILNILDITEGHLIYTPSEPVMQSPKLIRAVSDELIRLLARRPDLLYTIEPRKFEELIAEIFYRNGFHVELMKQTRDGGKDIIAIYNKMGILTKYVIECKRYSQSNKVSLGIVQRLLGVKISSSANKAILATTSTFTKDAVAFSSNHIWDLELRDYGDIVGWLKNTAR